MRGGPREEQPNVRQGPFHPCVELLVVAVDLRDIFEVRGFEREWLRVSNLAVGTGTVDLAFRRIGDDVSMAIARREGEIETVVTK